MEQRQLPLETDPIFPWFLRDSKIINEYCAFISIYVRRINLISSCIQYHAKNFADLNAVQLMLCMPWYVDDSIILFLYSFQVEGASKNELAGSLPTPSVPSTLRSSSSPEKAFVKVHVLGECHSIKYSEAIDVKVSLIRHFISCLAYLFFV